MNSVTCQALWGDIRCFEQFLRLCATLVNADVDSFEIYSSILG